MSGRNSIRRIPEKSDFCTKYCVEFCHCLARTSKDILNVWLENPDFANFPLYKSIFSGIIIKRLSPGWILHRPHTSTHGLVAQLGERSVRIREVEGSSPFESTTSPRTAYRSRRLFVKVTSHSFCRGSFPNRTRLRWASIRFLLQLRASFLSTQPMKGRQEKCQPFFLRIHAGLRASDA